MELDRGSNEQMWLFFVVSVPQPLYYCGDHFGISLSELKHLRDSSRFPLTKMDFKVILEVNSERNDLFKSLCGFSW